MYGDVTWIQLFLYLWYWQDDNSININGEMDPLLYGTPSNTTIKGQWCSRGSGHISDLYRDGTRWLLTKPCLYSIDPGRIIANSTAAFIFFLLDSSALMRRWSIFARIANISAPLSLFLFPLQSPPDDRRFCRVAVVQCTAFFLLLFSLYCLLFCLSRSKSFNYILYSTPLSSPLHLCEEWRRCGAGCNSYR